MKDVRRSIVCERARGYVSLELDGELSQFERTMLAAHVQRCPECRAYEAEVCAITGRLRDAAWEEPRRRVSVPRYRRVLVSFRSVQAGAAAAVVLASVGVGLNGAESFEQTGPSRFEQSSTAAVDADFRRVIVTSTPMRKVPRGGTIPI